LVQSKKKAAQSFWMSAYAIEQKPISKRASLIEVYTQICSVCASTTPPKLNGNFPQAPFFGAMAK
jgi:hypothetical protein